VHLSDSVHVPDVIFHDSIKLQRSVFFHNDKKSSTAWIDNQKQYNQFLTSSIKNQQNFFISQTLHDNQTTTTARGNNNTVRAFTHLWADCDITSPTKEAREISEVDLEFLLEKINPRPTTILSSGNGYHFYWRFEETKFDTASCVQLEFNLTKHLQGLASENTDFLRFDSVHDSARIMRAFESVNFKDKDNPRTVSTFYSSYDFYDLDDFKSIPHVDMVKKDLVQIDKGSQGQSAQVWEQIQNHPTSNQYLLHWIFTKLANDDYVVEDWSSFDYGIACICVKNGLTSHATYIGARFRKLFCKDGKNKHLRAEYWDRTLKKALQE